MLFGPACTLLAPEIMNALSGIGLASILALASACSSPSTPSTTTPEQTGSGSSASSCEVGAPLTGTTYDVARSKFAFGSAPTTKTEFGYAKWVGAHGTVAIAKNGSEIGAMNARALETDLPDWSSDTAALSDHVKDYFIALGVPSCQIETQGMGGSSGQTIGLTRHIGGIAVVESVAYAKINRDDQSTSEGLYWPTVPADVVSAGRALRDRLLDPAALADYRAKLPAQARGEGSVVIHHSRATSDSGTFRAAAAWDVIVGNSYTSSFDADGAPLDLNAW
jgi:hypothetical protein